MTEGGYREVALSRHQLLEAVHDYAVKHELVWGEVLEYGKLDTPDAIEFLCVRWTLPPE
jgi:hypothetical protein